MGAARRESRRLLRAALCFSDISPSRARLYKVMQSPQEFAMWMFVAMWMFDIAICQMSGSEMKLSLRIFSSG